MNKKIMAINAGSSSLKFQLFEMPKEKLLIKGVFERIGEVGESLFSCQSQNKKCQEHVQLNSHQEAIAWLLTFLKKQRVITSFKDIKGVGHRVAHGGEYFADAVIVEEKEEKLIASLSRLAPLHNPVNLLGIQAFKQAIPTCPQVGIFDTSFHQTLEKQEYIYPIPYKYYREDKIRKYGFHGTSHKFVTEEVAKLLNRPLDQLHLIICHIGNGASICGVKNGQSKLTGMGFTPLAGLMMGTRCGDIDPSIVTYLQEEKNLTSQEILHIMNEKSGLLGISEYSNDSRDVIKAAEKGDTQAQLALAIYVAKIRQTIGAYLAELGKLDALIFTAGVGENSSIIRKMVCQELAVFGISIDSQKNQENQSIISDNQAKVKVMVVPTNEELMIVRDTYGLLELARVK